MSPHEVVAVVDRALVPQVGSLTLSRLARDVLKRVEDDHIKAFAGNLAFRGLFAIFALTVLALSVLGVFGSRDLVTAFLDETSRFLPRSMHAAIEEQIVGHAAEASADNSGLRTAIPIVGALYGLSALARSVIDAMNAMYDIRERRPFIKRQAASLVMSLVVLSMLLGGLVIVAVGPEITVVMRYLRWPILLAGVLLAFALVYAFAPSVKAPVRLISYGAVVMLPAWVTFSLLFTLFVERFGRFTETYGSLAGIIVLLLYMFASALIMLVGAEINQVVDTYQDRAEPEPSS